MRGTMPSPKDRAALRVWKSVAVPIEHGGWGFTLEPILLGLLLSASLASAGVAIFSFFGFLTRTPLKLALADLRRGKRYPRTRVAWVVAGIYAAVALVGLAVVVDRGQPEFWRPLLAAFPLVAVQLYFDVQNRGRALWPQLLGAMALASVAAAMVLASGGEPAVAWAAWALLSLRALASVIYARSMVRRARRQAVSIPATVAVQAAVAALGLGAAAVGFFPWLAALALVILAMGSSVFLLGPPLPARVVGWSQIGFGLLVVILSAIGFRLNL